MTESTNHPASKALDTVDNLICEWLVRNGSLQAFSKLPASMAYRDENTETLPTRSRLLQLIRNGNILEAIALFKQNFAENYFKEDSPDRIEAYFLFISQQFIELIREGNFAGAFSWAQAEMIPFSEKHECCKSWQPEILGLLAYQEPLASPIRHLLDKSRHVWLANLVNKSIMSTSTSALEAALRQLMAIDQVLEEVGGFTDESDIKKWSTLQYLLSGTSLATRGKNIPAPQLKVKTLKND